MFSLDLKFRHQWLLVDHYHSQRIYHQPHHGLLLPLLCDRKHFSAVIFPTQHIIEFFFLCSFFWLHKLLAVPPFWLLSKGPCCHRPSTTSIVVASSSLPVLHHCSTSMLLCAVGDLWSNHVFSVAFSWSFITDSPKFSTHSPAKGSCAAQNSASKSSCISFFLQFPKLFFFLEHENSLPL